METLSWFLTLPGLVHSWEVAPCSFSLKLLRKNDHRFVTNYFLPEWHFETILSLKLEKWDPKKPRTDVSKWGKRHWQWEKGGEGNNEMVQGWERGSRYSPVSEKELKLSPSPCVELSWIDKKIQRIFIFERRGKKTQSFFIRNMHEYYRKSQKYP